MNQQEILEELLALLDGSGVTIRQEPLGGSGGGLCTVKGEEILFVDTEAPSAETADICAEAASKVIDTEKVYIKPQVRELIEKYLDSGRGAVRDKN